MRTRRIGVDRLNRMTGCGTTVPPPVVTWAANTEGDPSDEIAWTLSSVSGLGGIFEYREVGGGAWTEIQSWSTGGAEPDALGTITGLDPNTEYEYRAATKYGAGDSITSSYATGSATTAAGLSLVAGYEIRLVADDLAGGNGASVTTWAGDGVTLSSSGTAPTIQSPGIGSRKSVNFIGSGYLSGALSSSLAAPATYHIVLEADQVADAAFILDSTTGRHAVFQAIADGTKLTAYQSAFGTTLTGVFTVNPNVVTIVFDGSSSKIRINGSAIATVDSGTNATSATMYLGVANDGSSFPFDGRIAAVIAYSGTLSDADIIANEESLCTYYGIDFAGYTIGDTTVDGQDVRILRPIGLSDATAAPLCIYHHGYGEDEISLTGDPLKQSVIAAVIAAGYRIASSNAHGNNWGNQDAMDDYKELYDALVSASVNISRVVFLAQSMGGASALNCLADTATWGSVVKGCYGIYPVCDLDSMTAGFGGSIDSAYPPSGDYTGYNPIAITASAFSGKRLRFTASASDTTVDKTDNADAMSTHVAGGGATEYAVVTHTGNHGDPSAFLPSDVVDFFSRCT